MRVRKLILGGLMAVLLLGLVGCGGGDDDGDDNVLGNERANADVVLSDSSPFYDPQKLTIPLNREVAFTVLNEGKKIHNITIPGFAIDMDVEPGKTIEIKLPASSAPRDGFYTLYCKYHQSEGEATRLNIEG